MIVLHDLQLDHNHQALTWNDMREAPLLLASQPQPGCAPTHPTTIKRLSSICRVNGRHEIMPIVQRDARSRVSDVGGEADNAGYVQSEALHWVPVWNEGG